MLHASEATWRTLPAPYAYPGARVRSRDIGLHGTDLVSDGVAWVPATPGIIVLAHQAWPSDDATDSGTTPIRLFSYILPYWLLNANSTLIVDAKASWPGSTTLKTLGLYFGSALVASTTNNSSAANVATKWEGLEIQSRSNDATAFLGEAALVAGDNALQTASFSTVSATPNAYREISIRGNFGTAGAGSNRITLQYARLSLAWGG